MLHPSTRAAICGIILAATLCLAQDWPTPGAPARPVIGNDGTPMLVPFHCTEEDIRMAGLSCSEDSPCGIFLEISAVEAFSGHVIVAGNIHSDAATITSVVLQSDDNARTWFEAAERVRGAALDHVESAGGDNAWIAGQEVSPLTQNPFLLVTRDGGKTWKLRPVLSDDNESRFGSVQQFFFNSPESGALILDRGAGGGRSGRYALYETQNAGESWALKQESQKPIAVKRTTQPPVSDWRIRPDAGMKSYILEHHAGTRWSAVAAFLVRLEPCKPTGR